MWSELRNCDVNADFPTPDAPNMATVYWIGDDSSNRVSAVAPPLQADEVLREPLEALLEDDAEQMGEKSSELVLELTMFELCIWNVIFATF